MEKATLEEVRAWSKSSKEKLTPIRELRRELKQNWIAWKIYKARKNYSWKSIHNVRFEWLKRKKKSMLMQRRQMEEEWLKKTAELRQVRESISVPASVKPQSVKLQKYTITPLKGDYKDWICFWNQFSVEVDGSAISKISKFNYLLQLIKGKPREDIL